MPQGNPAVIAALNEVYRLLLSNEVQAHIQEHCYESEGYKKVSKWFDVIEDKGHRKTTHHVLDRINALGGEPTTAWGFQPDPARPIEQLDAAVDGQLRRLGDIHAAYGRACEAAEAADDYVTEKMIWCHLEWIEKQQGKFEGRAAAIREVGLEEYLAEMFDR